ncbi:MAG: response regulator [Treponema sp.]|jgi:CheY-like chemotaxis protein|nr:response regulator [Treponema sp.]
MNDEKKLIILVDDSEVNLHIGRNALAGKYAVLTAPSAVELFSLLEKNTPAFILLDIDMPGMNGFEAITILKTKKQTQNIPVIFLSSRDGTNDINTGFSLGAVDFIHKPYNPKQLLDRIAKAELI